MTTRMFIATPITDAIVARLTLARRAAAPMRGDTILTIP